MWALIDTLPPESAWQRRRHDGRTPLEENVATLLDFIVHTAIADYRSSTFDPEAYPEHAELATQAKRARRMKQTPPELPSVVPVALRPEGWSLTEDLTRLPEPAVEEVHGHEAHVRLLALLA
ncbi:hypothetical protein [Blastococcus sp. CCUG 61487]|uniref:hypothetical protein n=1 Tax=Blastococcus sp. CCUG 61487 TaxID=1840703 RepID=UPI0010C0C501|nr:hypothetical protein [Blastococcus sp. CCUG 61487]TKJ25217.1 hypothetical protein A6V29_04130 [Blastococcus sp. CCUG 61487]